MLKLRKGCSVPFPEKLCEGYQYSKPCYYANVDADKIENLLEHFVFIHNEPLFFILELPLCKADEELRFAKGAEDFGKAVYYIDGCTQDEAISLLGGLAELLINDGLCSFGFGCHDSKDEIMVGKYNLVTLYTKTPKEYTGFFEEHKINKVDKLLTAADTFSTDAPGCAARVETDGKTVFDIPALYKDWGIYLADKKEN